MYLSRVAPLTAQDCCVVGVGSLRVKEFRLKAFSVKG